MTESLIVRLMTKRGREPGCEDYISMDRAARHSNIYIYMDRVARRSDIWIGLRAAAVTMWYLLSVSAECKY